MGIDTLCAIKLNRRFTSHSSILVESSRIEANQKQTMTEPIHSENPSAMCSITAFSLLPSSTVAMAVKRTEQDTYLRFLYAKNRGFSSYNPVARTSSFYADAYIPTGAQVGDLAIHRTNGTVSYIGLNVTLPADAPRNLDRGNVIVRIKDYAPVPFEEGVDYLRDDARFPAPCVIGGTNDLRHPLEITHNNEDGPIRYILVYCCKFRSCSKDKC